MRKAWILAALALPGMISAALAAPFGLEMGRKDRELSILRWNGDGTIALAAVPRPYPGIKSYFARYEEATGLCSIAGATATFEHDRYGTQARRFFIQLKQQLDGLYGTSTSYDFQTGGESTNPADWVAQLHRNSRIYHTFWNTESGASLKDSVQSISLSIAAASDDAAYVMIQYDFSNISACEKARQTRHAAAL